MQKTEISEKIVLYIGGFELPDKNAAAHRVVGIAKGLRELGYTVIFLNSLKPLNVSCGKKIYKKKAYRKKRYFKFSCFEYERESLLDYFVTAKTCLARIRQIRPDIIFAYNYPGFALEKIRKYCVAHDIQCYADVTEWYQVKSTNPVYCLLKAIDTSYRMKYVQKKLDGVLTISRFLYNYYRNTTKAVMIPPSVDLADEKWKQSVKKERDGILFVYAGSPSEQKERLDLIVDAIEHIPDSQKVCLYILGVTKEQFKRMYKWKKCLSDKVKFGGRVGHKQAVMITKQADWSIIIRKNNFVVRAGFPTKLVESISCGTPVIINQFSNVKDYLKNSDCIYAKDAKLGDAFIQACSTVKKPDTKTFDFHNYIPELEALLK